MTRFRIMVATIMLTTAIGLSLATLPSSPILAVVEASEIAAVSRCGWFVNPTPGNAWLIDGAGEWIIGVQGGFQARGAWPSFSAARWVETNGNYGYGCACMKVDSNASSGRIIRIYSASSRPLSTCRNDRAIRGSEPSE